MSQFIHPDNQKLLWDTIHKSPKIQYIHPSQRDSWFRSKIQDVYNQYGGQEFVNRRISMEDLNRLNQDVVRNMVRDLDLYVPVSHHKPRPPQQQPMMQPQYQSQLQPQQPIMQQMPQPIMPQLPPPIMTQPAPAAQPVQQPFANSYIQNAPSRPYNTNNMDSLQNVYMEKKTEMESLMAKKVPEQIDFSYKEKDVPIGNMEEMVQRYMKERELDVPAPAPAAGPTGPIQEPPKDPPPSQEPSPGPYQEPYQESNNITYDIVDSPKHVVEQPPDIGQEVMDKIERLEEQNKEITKRLKEVEALLEEYKKMIAKPEPEPEHVLFEVSKPEHVLFEAPDCVSIPE